MTSYRGLPFTVERGWKLIRGVDKGLRKEREHLHGHEYIYHLNEAQAWLTHKAIRQSFSLVGRLTNKT